jgi:predicted DNA-binding transcriptional regulator AlpA
MDFVVTKEELCQMLKISARTLVKLRKEKDFPQPFSLTGHDNSRDLWIIDDVKTWVRERAKQNKANAS